MFETNNLTTPFICVPSEPKLGGYFDFCSITHRQENVAEQHMYSLLGWVLDQEQ